MDVEVLTLGREGFWNYLVHPCYSTWNYSCDFPLSMKHFYFLRWLSVGFPIVLRNILSNLLHFPNWQQLKVLLALMCSVISLLSCTIVVFLLRTFGAVSCLYWALLSHLNRFKGVFVCARATFIPHACLLHGHGATGFSLIQFICCLFHFTQQSSVHSALSGQQLLFLM